MKSSILILLLAMCSFVMSGAQAQSIGIFQEAKDVGNPKEYQGKIDQ